MTIRLLLALTALIAITMLMLRVFWFGDGLPGAMLPAVLVGEAIWVGTSFACFAIRHEDLRTRKPNVADQLVIAVLFGTLVIQIALPLKMLREFGIAIAG